MEVVRPARAMIIASAESRVLRHVGQGGHGGGGDSTSSSPSWGKKKDGGDGGGVGGEWRERRERGVDPGGSVGQKEKKPVVVWGCCLISTAC